jgi:hypothetical protein
MRKYCGSSESGGDQETLERIGGSTKQSWSEVYLYTIIGALLAHLPEVPSFCPSFSSFPDKQCRFLLTQPHHRFNQGPAHAGTVTARINSAAPYRYRAREVIATLRQTQPSSPPPLIITDRAHRTQ